MGTSPSLLGPCRSDRRRRQRHPVHLTAPAKLCSPARSAVGFVWETRARWRHLSDGGSECGLSVVNVSDGTNVEMRLGALECGHPSHPSCYEHRLSVRQPQNCTLSDGARSLRCFVVKGACHAWQALRWRRSWTALTELRRPSARDLASQALTVSLCRSAQTKLIHACVIRGVNRERW